VDERSSTTSGSPWYSLHDALVALIEEQGLTAGAVAEVSELLTDRVERILRGERASAEELTVLLPVALGVPPDSPARKAGESAEVGEDDWTDRSLPAEERHRSKLKFLGFRQDGRGGSNALATGVGALGVGVADLEDSTGIPASRVRSILAGDPPSAEELEEILAALPKLHGRQIA
jgi:transcriptional regulator with XRE-family HTH domain